MKKFLLPALLTISFSLFTIHCPAQKYGQQKIDSLLSILKNDNAYWLETGKHSLPEDTNKVNLLLDLGLNYANLNNTDEGMKYADEAYLLAKKLGWKRGIALALIRKGNNYPVFSDSAKKFGSYREALRLFEELKDKEGMARVAGNTGSAYYTLAEYSKSLEYYKKQYELSTEIGSNPLAAFAIKGIANIYFITGKYPEALIEYFAMLKLNEETGNKPGIADALSCIGLINETLGNKTEALNNDMAALKIYEEIGDKAGAARSHNAIAVIYNLQGDTAKALEGYFNAVKLNEEINDKGNLAFVHANIAGIYDGQHRYPESLKEVLVALSIAEDSGDKITMAYIYSCVGWATIRTKNIREAKDWFNKGLNLSKEIGAKADISINYQGLASADSISGDYKSAYENYQLYILYRDSLNQQEATEKAVQTKMQYEFEQKENLDKAEQDKKDVLANAELQKRKIIQYASIGGMLVLLLFALGMYKRYSEKMKANLVLEKTLQDLKDTQALLVKSEKMAAFGVMASRVSHEIQNPLNFVNNFSDLAEDMVHDIVKSNSEQERNETAKDLINNLQKIKQHGKRADTIVKQLQEHTRAGTAHEYFDEKS